MCYCIDTTDGFDKRIKCWLAECLRIIHPENTSRLPPHMSLTAKLLSSPRALQRIINFIHGRPAYIVPGIVGDEDITLSVKLNIPLLAPHPHHRHAVMIRSGARAVFKTAGVMTAPSQMFPRIKHSNVDIKTSPLRPGIQPVPQLIGWTWDIIPLYYIYYSSCGTSSLLVWLSS